MVSTELEILKAVVTFVSGGLAGAVLTYFVSRHRQQVEFVIKITDRYLDEFSEIASCKDILLEPSKLKDASNLNRVRKLGDWFEMIAVFYDSEYLSKGLLEKVGLLVELRKFHELVTQRKNEAQSPVNDAWLWCPTIRSIRRAASGAPVNGAMGAPKTVAQ
jgi:hypothetical protein